MNDENSPFQDYASISVDDLKDQSNSLLNLVTEEQRPLRVFMDNGKECLLFPQDVLAPISVNRYAQFISDGRGAISVPIHTLQFPAFKFIHHSGFLAFDSFHSRTGSRISGVRFRSSGRADRSFYRRANSTLSG